MQETKNRLTQERESLHQEIGKDSNFHLRQRSRP